MDIVLLVLSLLLTATWVVAIVDAVRQPTESWRRLGRSRTLWIVLLVIFGVFGAAVYFVSLAPKLRAAPLLSGDSADSGSVGSGAHLRGAADTILRVEDLVVEFPVGRTGLRVHAVTGVSLDLRDGETLGLVGESGCGKSTTGRAIMQFPKPTAGRVVFDGTDLTTLNGEELRRTRTQMQMIFQDPISSLNPRRTIGDIVSEPLNIWKRGTPAEREARVDEVLDAVGLDPVVAKPKRPHEFSGGQCQRIAIARALVLEPKVIICDEPVSALDVSVQAQILNLLEDMKARYQLTMVFIAHDLAVVKNISDRVAVMYLGKLCEVAAPDDLYATPAHPYTRALLTSIPVPDPTTRPDPDGRLQGEIPSPVVPPSGCRFRTRCPLAQERCAQEVPQMRRVDDDHYVACHFPLVEVAAEPAAATA